jgi:hypothetical protein
MSLRGLNSRLIGDYYIGRRSAEYHPDLSIRKPKPEPEELYEKFDLKYKRDPDIESFETLSIEDGSDSFGKPKPLEYRITGITWFTPRFINTCNLDSFLSAWVRKMRQTHGSYLKYLTLIDRVANILICIADHALCAKDQINAETVKVLWLMGALHNSNEKHVLRNPPVDCTGNNIHSVFQHLQHHSNFEIVSKCSCGICYHRDFILEVYNLQQVQYLGTPRDLSSADMPKCQACQQKRILLELNPEPDNWLLPFRYTGSHAKGNLSPLLDDIPQIVEMGDIRFKLEYITFSQDVPSNPGMCHEVSLQKIRTEWYLYDGLRSPKFRRFGGKKYEKSNARLTAIVYFRI